MFKVLFLENEKLKFHIMKKTLCLELIHVYDPLKLKHMEGKTLHSS